MSGSEPVGETLDLIEWICTHTVVGFNLVFDWFHIVKIYTIFSLCPRDWIPEEHIEEIALLEPLLKTVPASSQSMRLTFSCTLARDPTNP
jgi:hypothetical protein